MAEDTITAKFLASFRGRNCLVFDDEREVNIRLIAPKSELSQVVQLLRADNQTILEVTVKFTPAR